MNKEWRNMLIFLGIIAFLIWIFWPSDTFNIDYENSNQTYEKNHLYEELEDDFPNIEELHWGHMPLNYKFENEVTERQTNLIRVAFKKIEEETLGIVRFEEVMENSDISIYFKPAEYNYSGGNTVADALVTEVDYSRNLIIKGELNFYGQGFVCNTGYPGLEVHEILHLFDLPHNPLVNSIMSPYTTDSSSKCQITQIDKEYISCLRYIYSNGQINGSCNFPNVIHEKEPEYSCDEGWYLTIDGEYCCPEPSMIINEEGYCDYSY